MTIAYGPSAKIGFVQRVRSLFSWQRIATVGAWEYQENSRTGERRAIKIAALHGPLHRQWLDGGAWQQQRPPPPPSAMRRTRPS